ncbi:hypothetical protein PR048_019684, partial [Dryococelus australis]
MESPICGVVEGRIRHRNISEGPVQTSQISAVGILVSSDVVFNNMNQFPCIISSRVMFLRGQNGIAIRCEAPSAILDSSATGSGERCEAPVSKLRALPFRSFPHHLLGVLVCVRHFGIYEKGIQEKHRGAGRSTSCSVILVEQNRQAKALSFLLSFLGQKHGLDVGQDITLCDRQARQQLVQLLVVADGKLEVPFCYRGLHSSLIRALQLPGIPSQQPNIPEYLPQHAPHSCPCAVACGFARLRTACDNRAEHLPHQRHRGENPRPSGYKSTTLPLSYEGKATTYSHQSTGIKGRRKREIPRISANQQHRPARLPLCNRAGFPPTKGSRRLSFCVSILELSAVLYRNHISHIMQRTKVTEHVSLLVSHQGEQRSTPGRVTPVFSHVGIVPDDAADRRDFSEISRFPRPFIPVLLHTHRLSIPRRRAVPPPPPTRGGEVEPNLCTPLDLRLSIPPPPLIRSDTPLGGDAITGGGIFFAFFSAWKAHLRTDYFLGFEGGLSFYTPPSPNGKLRTHCHVQFMQGDTLKNRIKNCKESAFESHQVMPSIPPATSVGTDPTDDCDKTVSAKEGVSAANVDEDNHDFLDALTHPSTTFAATSDMEKAADVKNALGVTAEHFRVRSTIPSRAEDCRARPSPAEASQAPSRPAAQLPFKVLGILHSSHQGEPGSIPGRVTPGFSHMGIIPDDAAGRPVFSGTSRFPNHLIPVLLHNHPQSPSSTLKLSLIRAAQIFSSTHPDPTQPNI